MALQAVERLRTLGGPEVDNLILMAAAVPEGLCAEGRIYSRSSARKETILHSQKDSVLSRWFPLGQAIARRLKGELDPGPLQTAVGLKGGPSGRWNS